MAVVTKMSSSGVGEVGKGAVGNLAGNILTDIVENVKNPLVLILLLVLLPLLVWILKEKLLWPKQIAELCTKVDAKRKRISEDKRVSSDMSLMKGAATLQRNWLNRLFNNGVCEQVKAQNDLDALIEQLKNVRLLFGTSEFLARWSLWSDVESDESGPAVGIDTRAEKSEPNYETKSKDLIVTKIIMQYSQWRRRYRPSREHIFVKWIGANDVELVEAVLRGFSDSFPEGEVHVWLAKDTIKSKYAAKLSKAFADPHDGVTIEESSERDGGYDVLLSTHFWQHHSRDVLNRGGDDLIDDGLFVLLAAVSRDSKSDEYVCEGCMPMRAKICETQKEADVGVRETPGAYAIDFRPMGCFDKRRWIAYTPIKKNFEDHVPVLAWGFPKSAVVDRSIVGDDARLGEWVRNYFQWGKESDAADFLRRSGDGMPKQPDVILGGVHVLARSHSVGKNATVSEYLVLELEYRIADAPEHKVMKLPFIVAVGYEKNEWEFESDVRKTPITIHPAIELNKKTLIRNKDGVLDLVLVDSSQDKGRYVRYMPEGPCASTKWNRVWRIHTRIYEVDLSDFLIFEASYDACSSRRAFYSYFPKRRYLTQRGYERGHQMLDRYKTWSKGLRLKSGEYCDVPIRFDSVTWLWSFDHIVRFCRARGLRMDNDQYDVFFHKSYCALTEDAAKKVGLSLGCETPTYKILSDSICSVAKDEAFNQLQVSERIRLLACMNVHNVLVFARKDNRV